MKKIIMTSLLVALLLITGCGNKKEEPIVDNKGGTTGENAPVVEENVTYEGLEFLNVGASNGSVSTIVINNTGRVLNTIKFTMKIMDNEGNTIVELTEEVKESMENGTTKEIETKTDKDLSNASSIEYSVIK